MEKFEIRLYDDGGPNDRGYCVGYVDAEDRVDAKKRFAKGKRNASDIINTGFYQARKISLKEFKERELEAKATLAMFKNFLNK